MAFDGRPENLRVSGVNGFETLTSFTQYLISLKAELLARLTRALPEIEPAARALFLKQAVTRSRILAATIGPMVAGNRNYVSESRSEPATWGFSHPNFRNEQKLLPDEETRQALIGMTRRYAAIWRHVAGELTDELRCFIFTSHYLSMVKQQEEEIPQEKIPVRYTVAELAAFARLLFEIHAVELDNKSQFCGLIAHMFSTPKQKNISKGSLKNHFDVPLPENIDRICEDLRKMLNSAQKLKNIY